MARTAEAMTAARSSRGSYSRTAELEHAVAKRLNFGAKSRVRLYQRLKRFTERNFDLKRTIDSMNTRFQRTGDARRAVFTRMSNQLQEGNKFSAVIAPYVPAAERLMISAGEEAGHIPMGFEQAIFVCDAVRKMRSTLVGALVYPAVLLMMLAGILIAIALKFMPVMLTMAPLEEWPAISKVVYWIAQAVIHVGPWAAGGFILGIIAVTTTMSSWQGKLRRNFDKWLPPYTIYREYQGSTFLISLAALVEAGRPVNAAIKHIKEISTPWLRWHLMRIDRSLREGTKPGRALDTGMLHREVVGDIEDYSNAGAFDSVLGQLGRDAVDDSITRIAAAAKVITTLCLFLVAGTIMLIYTAMIFLVMEVAKKAQLPG